MTQEIKGSHIVGICFTVALTVGFLMIAAVGGCYITSQQSLKEDEMNSKSIEQFLLKVSDVKAQRIIALSTLNEAYIGSDIDDLIEKILVTDEYKMGDNPTTLTSNEVEEIKGLL
jgi:hypothetical protein